MNEEPTYSYVKGKGWLPLGHQVYYGIICGRNVKMEQRKPELGEYWLAVWSDDPYYLDANGMVKFSELEVLYRNLTWDNFISPFVEDESLAHEDAMFRSGVINYRRLWVTVTPYE